MKRMLLSVIFALCAALCIGCAAAPADPGTPAPCILLDGQAYYAPEMPVYELPPGYEYAGTLSEEQANTAGLAGHEFYTDPAQQPVTDFYVFQETGTPVGGNTVDTTRRQWMYVRWSLPKK